MPNGKTMKERVVALEVLMRDTRKDIEDGFKTLKENDLKHIWDKLNAIEKNINSRPTWVVTILSVLVTGLVMYVVTNK